MFGKVKGAVSLIEKEMRNAGIERKLVRTHCIIHLEALCAKSLKMQEVMRVVIKIVNFVRARGLYHRQFQHMLEEMDNQYGDLLYYCEVRWLSRGEMLQGVYQLRAELTNFLKEKGMEVPELSDTKWMTDFAFLVDITNHLNMVNSKIKGMNQLINVLYGHLYAFEVKLQLWDLQLKESNCIHFPALRSHQPCDVSYYAEFISDLKDQFNTRFADMGKHRKYFSNFTTIFDVEICDAPENLQMELIELQSSSELKSRFREVPLLEFYQYYLTPQRFASLVKHAKEVAVLFGSTYVCEQFLSNMKYVKQVTHTVKRKSPR